MKYLLLTTLIMLGACESAPGGQEIPKFEVAQLDNTFRCAVKRGEWLEDGEAKLNQACVYPLKPNVFSKPPTCICSSAEGSQSAVCDAVASDTQLKITGGFLGKDLQLQVSVFCSDK